MQYAVIYTHDIYGEQIARVYSSVGQARAWREKQLDYAHLYVIRRSPFNLKKKIYGNYSHGFAYLMEHGYYFPAE
jgi:hypothetical protein